MSNEFKEAQSKLTTLKKDPGNEVKLKLYGLFKQATTGDCNTSKPGAMDFVGKAKWNAWNDLKGTSKKDAEKNYIDLVKKLVGDVEVKSSGSFKEIQVSIEFENVYKITLNRPTKYNAITSQMYQEITEALNEAESNPKVLICAITGNGSYYSSGNDLTNYMKVNVENPEEEIERGAGLVETFVNKFIDFKKPLIALVNGPCLGIMFTTLALFDLVIASDKATFSAPFTELALSPEGCSSFTFPLLMGRQKASEVLLFNRRLNAVEAFERNLVNQVVPEKDFKKVCDEKLALFAKIPQNSLLDSTNFIRDMYRQDLKRVNREEMNLLKTRIKSGEFMQAVLTFMSKKSKL